MKVDTLYSDSLYGLLYVKWHRRIIWINVNFFKRLVFCVLFGFVTTQKWQCGNWTDPIQITMMFVKRKTPKIECAIRGNFQSFNVKQLRWMFYEEKVIVRWRSIFIIFSMYFFFQIKCSKNILKLTNFLTILSNVKLFSLLQRSFHFFYKEESWWKLVNIKWKQILHFSFLCKKVS